MPRWSCLLLSLLLLLTLGLGEAQVCNPGLAHDGARGYSPRTDTSPTWTNGALQPPLGSAITAVTVLGQRGPLGGFIDATQMAGADLGTQINAALAALPDQRLGDGGSGGATILVPAGVYAFTTPIVSGTRQAFCLQGEGYYTHNSYTGSSRQQAATHLIYQGTGAAMTLGHGTIQAQGICLRHLRLTTPANPLGIDILSQSAFGIMENVMVSGPTGSRVGTGIRVGTANYTWRFTNVQLENWHVAIDFLGNNGATVLDKMTVLRNTTGIRVGEASVVGGLQIRNSAIELNDSVGIDITDAYNVTIDGNYFEGAGTAGSLVIRVGATASKTPENVTITNNYFVPGGGAGSADYAIALHRVTGASLFFNVAGQAFASAFVNNVAASVAEIRYGWNRIGTTPAPLSSLASGIAFFENAAAIYTGTAIMQLGGPYGAANRGLYVDGAGSTSWDSARFKNNDLTTFHVTGAGRVGVGRPALSSTRLAVDGGTTTTDDLLIVQNKTLIGLNITGAGVVTMEQLKTTGAAGGKHVVCVDPATGILYASSTGVDCSD